MGIIEITADAEYATYIFELGPQDCANVGVNSRRRPALATRPS